MSAKEQRGSRIRGFDIRENDCIWTKADIVTFKRCENVYDCNSCQFDKAMQAATQSRKKGSDLKPTFRERSKAQSCLERRCRHMLTGRVAVKRCPNDFRCDLCEFDQFLEDTDALRPGGAVNLSVVENFLYAENYYYHPGHTWARVEYGGRVRIGVDHFAMKWLGTPTGWNLPAPGRKISVGEPALSLVRGVDAAGAPAPVEGTVIAVNLDVLEDPSLAQAAPFQEGWLLLLEPDKLKRDLENLHFGEEGHEWLCNECAAFRRFLEEVSQGAPAEDISARGDWATLISRVEWKKLVKAILKTD